MKSFVLMMFLAAGQAAFLLVPVGVSAQKPGANPRPLSKSAGSAVETADLDITLRD